MRDARSVLLNKLRQAKSRKRNVLKLQLCIHLRVSSAYLHVRKSAGTVTKAWIDTQKYILFPAFSSFSFLLLSSSSFFFCLSKSFLVMPRKDGEIKLELRSNRIIKYCCYCAGLPWRQGKENDEKKIRFRDKESKSHSTYLYSSSIAAVATPGSQISSYSCYHVREECSSIRVLSPELHAYILQLVAEPSVCSNSCICWTDSRTRRQLPSSRSSRSTKKSKQ